MRQSISQFLRFAVVGISNTAIDFVVTNILVLALSPKGGVGLMLISITACTTATLNSYVLNRRWTFRDTAGRPIPGALPKFFLVAFLSMAVNTSVFLFVAKYLPDRLPMDPLLAINVAKLAGVSAAFVVSFLGYRFGVFQTDAIRIFRNHFWFASSASPPFSFQAGVLLVSALAVRLIYLFLTTAVFGDAVSYAWVAESLAQGKFEQIDVFWSSLFCYWEALLRYIGLSRIPAAILASLLPGALLVLPATWIARQLYGSRVAWLAGILCVLHPRLVEYSCNGYSETFYVCAFAFGTALAIRVVDKKRWWPALGWGMSFGLFAAVRSEGVLVFVLSLLLVGTLLAVGKSASSGGKVKIAALLAFAMTGFLATSGAYALLSQATLGTPGMFQKTTNLAKQFSEQLDTREAARETYGSKGALYGEKQAPTTLSDKVKVLLVRIPRNILYTLERLPGVLLSPLPLFALLLPLFVGLQGRSPAREAPLLLMLFFPLLFYPLIQVEPRLLFALLVPLIIFGCAGLLAFSAYAEQVSNTRYLYPLLAGFIIFLSGALGVWRGIDVERDYSFHRELASWLENNVPTGDVMVGCGYGYVSTTGFLAGRRTIPRLWTENPEELASFAEEKGSNWIVLYEAFLRKANPELLPVLDSTVPGFQKVAEIKDFRGNRSQVFQRLPDSSEVF